MGETLHEDRIGATHSIATTLRNNVTPMIKKKATPAVVASAAPRHVKRLASAGTTSSNDWEEF